MANIEQVRTDLLNMIADSNVRATIEALRKKQRTLSEYKTPPYGYSYRTIDAVAAVAENPTLHEEFAHIVDAVPREQWDVLTKCANYWGIEAEINRLTAEQAGDDEIKLLCKRWGIDPDKETSRLLNI